jgi:hypothetical protein
MTMYNLERAWQKQVCHNRLCEDCVRTYGGDNALPVEVIMTRTSVLTGQERQLRLCKGHAFMRSLEGWHEDRGDYVNNGDSRDFVTSF